MEPPLRPYRIGLIGVDPPEKLRIPHSSAGHIAGSRAQPIARDPYVHAGTDYTSTNTRSGDSALGLRTARSGGRGGYQFDSTFADHLSLPKIF